MKVEIDQMNIELVPVRDLISYEFNPKAHPPEQVAMIAESIRKYGFRQPLSITEKKEIITGHGRRLAAIELGLSMVPCILVDNLTDEAARAYRIVDNKSAESHWKNDCLVNEILELKEKGENLGWTGLSFEQLQGEIEKAERSMKAQSTGAGEKPEVEFAQELLLEHNYIVLYFDNPLDWQVAVDKFGLKKVKDLIPRKAQPTGIGRVVPGAEWLERIS